MFLILGIALMLAGFAYLLSIQIRFFSAHLMHMGLLGIDPNSNRPDMLALHSTLEQAGKAGAETVLSDKATLLKTDFSSAVWYLTHARTLSRYSLFLGALLLFSLLVLKSQNT